MPPNALTAGMRIERVFHLVLRTLLKVSGVMASTWVLPWCLYRLHGIRLVGPPGEEIWYFAYGANVRSDSAFRDWRGVNPREWRPGRVRGYRLRFNLMAPRGKATYAIYAPIRVRRFGASFTRSPAVTSFGWRPPKAFRGEAIGRIGSMSKTLAARRYRPQLSWPKAITVTTPLASIPHAAAGGRTVCLTITFAFWSRSSTRDRFSRIRGVHCVRLVLVTAVVCPRTATNERRINAAPLALPRTKKFA